MFVRILLQAVALIAFCLSVAAEPKAYDVVRYTGKVADVTIALDYGDGYPAASEMKVSRRGEKKATRFALDESGELQFVPQKAAGDARKVVLKMSIDDAPPPKIAGTYTADGKTVEFTLVRQ